MSENNESVPTKRSSIWRWAAIGLVGAIAASWLVLSIGGKTPDYLPPYHLSVKSESKPVQVIRTPYRTIFTYRIFQPKDEAASQILDDLNKQNIRWRVHMPTDPLEGYRILDPATLDESQAEGLRIDPDPQDPKSSMVQMISPMQKPSRLETWRYAAEKILHGERN